MNILQPALKIVHYPHPSLRHPAVEVPFIDERIRHAAAAMLELMYEQHGLGLAAPQVGLPFQMFVVNYAGEAEQKEFEGVYINPVIIDKQGTMEGEEGCLSFPQLYRKVRRARTVHVQAYGLDGNPIELQISELPSRLWQHEIDHLHGKLFIDKLGPIGQLATRGVLRDFERLYKKAQAKGEIPPDEEIEKRLAELEREGLA